VTPPKRVPSRRKGSDSGRAGADGVGAKPIDLGLTPYREAQRPKPTPEEIAHAEKRWAFHPQRRERPADPNNRYFWAFDRMGRTDQDRARWLIDFAFDDLSNVSEDDRVNIAVEILVFTTHGQGYDIRDIYGIPGLLMGERAVREAQQWLRTGLVRMVLSGPAGGHWEFEPHVVYRFRWDRHLRDESCPSGT